MSRLPTLLLALVGVLAAAPPASADPTYWQDVRPLFRKYCTACHSAKNLKEVDVSGGLALDSYEAVMKGSKHAVIAPGKSADSILVQYLVTTDTKKRMPLDAPPLSAEQITLVRKWIDAGAKEGKRPDDAPDPIVVKKTPKRKLDLTLTTSTAPSKGAAKLELSLKVGPLAPMTAVAFSPDGKLLAAGSYGQVAVWDLTKAEPVKVLTNVLGAVNDVRFSPDGKLLAVGGGQPSAKGDLRLYQVADWKLLAVLRGHDDVVFSLAFRHDGKVLASASFDKTVRLWDAATHQPLQKFDGHSDFVYAVAFSPDGKLLASASKDRTVKVVEADSGKSRFTFSGMDQDVLALAWSPDGKQVISSGFETAIYWWNAQTGELVKKQAGHGVAVHELAFSKDGKVAVSAGADRTARVWDGATGAPLRTVAVGALVYAVAISPDRKWLATGSFDGLVRLWDPATGRPLLTLLALPAEKEQIDWLAQTPEGYTTGSAALTDLGRWRAGKQELAAAQVWPVLRQPNLVLRSLRGESVPEPVLGK